MRIAAISNSRIPSSTANSIQAMKVCDALEQAGNEVRLYVPAEGTPTGWEELAARYGLNYQFKIEWLTSRRPLKRLDFVWYAHAAARKFDSDLIYTWLPQTAAFESWLGRPVVLEMHADVAGVMGSWWLRQFWRGRRQRRLLVTTQALRRALERSVRMRFPDDSVQVAPNGVDLDRYANLPTPNDARAQLQLKPGFTAGFTGHFYAGRGINLLLELARALPQFNFLWVGGTPQAVEEWRSKLNALRHGNVTLTGFIDNSRLPLYQAAADVLLMPYGQSVSASSGQDIAEVINPMKMFEYMAAGRPIITAELPVIREILDETRAVFCPPGDVGAWTKALVDLAADAPRRESLGHSAREDVQNYTWLKRAQNSVRGMP